VGVVCSKAAAGVTNLSGVEWNTVAHEVRGPCVLLHFISSFLLVQLLVRCHIAMARTTIAHKALAKDQTVPAINVKGVASATEST
jgi:hypothetical protein